MTEHHLDDIAPARPRRSSGARGGRGLLIGLTLTLAACGGGPAPEAPVPRAATAPADPATDAGLAALLDAEVLSPELERRIRALDSIERPLPERLAAIAMDPAAPPFARGNALLLIGDLGATAHIAAFAAGLRADDPNVRAAAATGLEGFLDWDDHRPVNLLRRALRDEDPWVQARALQALGATEPDILRDYIGRAPTPELRSIAVSLLQLAQERGAPLAEVAKDGAAPPLLTRETSRGHRLVFRAEETWDTWGAGLGSVSVVRPSGDTARIADGVEAVAGVVPAFFSPEERWLVYEVHRTIHVRSLETGEDRVVGPGIAPRPQPFSQRFIFLVPAGVEPAQHGGGARITYDVMSAPFEGGPAERIGELSALPEMNTFGNYSPVRWMRVEQLGDSFFLAGDGVSELQLPDPFGVTAMP